MHGYLCDKTVFNGLIKILSPYFTCHAPDFCGFGENKDMPYPYCLDDYVEDLKKYMDKNGIVKPHVIAHSFGARVTVKCANQNLFGRIVLTGAAGMKPKTTLKKIVKKGCFKLLKPLLGKKRLKRFYSSDFNSLSPVMQQSFINVVNEHLESYACKVKNSTLLIYGENDKETPLYMAKRYNKLINGSKLIVIKNAGHFCFLDNVTLFSYYVKEFLLSERTDINGF